MRYPIATIGTLLAVVVGFAVERLGSVSLRRGPASPEERFWHRSNLRFMTMLVCCVVIALLWTRLFHNKSTFFGLVGAGAAVALREPLLSVAGRISIWAGRIYRIGDRIEFEAMAGDVIGIGVFYTRMLEIGNWVKADQATGRIVQFPNSMVYQHPVYNYTQNLRFIWDELTLPVTYGSDIEAACTMLKGVGEEYTREFSERAARDVERVQKSSLLPPVNVEPAVFTRVTSNYVELTLRYVVDPRQRRPTSSALFRRVFELVRDDDRIDIGSDTMDLTVHPPQKKSAQRKGGE